ncbi:hypothetical protein LEP1GSC196_0401 [Leptospira meyeri serovar Semaranga str. Veldrot Semarang 173]|nr:hypothetical protein LEP1GSC196_0401 [Leptospira meyeri serovar Semaranga str. Veldrot Semarang 173]
MKQLTADGRNSNETSSSVSFFPNFSYSFFKLCPISEKC